MSEVKLKKGEVVIFTDDYEVFGYNAKDKEGMFYREVDGNKYLVYLPDIFSRIETLGVALIKKTLTCGKIKYSPQDHSKASFFKRRTPKMSEIKVDDFKNFTAEELHNKIRSLQDPYPNAFISCKHSTKLFLQKSRIK